MKPLYWKLLLILGAMIVGASLVVPKALRKNTAQDADNVSQSLFLTGLEQNITFDVSTEQGEYATTIVRSVKYLPNIYSTKFSKLNFSILTRFIAVGNAPRHSLSAGTRPTKSRVID